MAVRLRGNRASDTRGPRVGLVAAGLLVVCSLLATPLAADVLVLPEMPRYLWWSGCAPTAAGMIFGYWNDPGLYPFYDGDASVWEGAQYDSNEANNKPWGTAAMVASWGHVHEGDVADYNTNIGCGKWTPDLRDADCIADFMGTNNGATTANGIVYGMGAFAAWDNPDTEDVNESVKVTTEIYWTFDSPDPWDVYTAEIDAGRPALVLLRAGTSGHAVAGYGYDTDGYMAVRDTWNDGTSNAPAGSYIDDDGVEWWPWNPTWTSSSPSYGISDMWESGEIAYGATNWTVDSIVTMDPKAVPEPGTMALVLLGVSGLVAWRRRVRGI